LDVIDIKVAPDYLERYIGEHQPLPGIVELIWNSLDEDATNVEVIFDENELGQLYQIRVKDDGDGLPFSSCRKSFGPLGGSPKLHRRKTPSGRAIQGKNGRGRFLAFAVGRVVQ
jgi:DNA topoisomerase VI subunit B